MIAALATMSLVMALAWIWQRYTGNGGWADMFWSYGIGLAAAVILLRAPTPHAWLVMATLGLWSLRLGTAIGLRSRGAAEDPRYAKFRADWGRSFQPKMFIFLQIQALASWPLLFAVRAAGSRAQLGWHDAIAVAVALGSIAGETIADDQLRQFRAQRLGTVCDRGLWRYSRHPNYFFEFCGWCALPLFAWPSPTLMLIAAAAPLGIYLLLVHVSGIPPLEAHMLASRGDVFRAYQARTSAFFPMLPTEPPS